MFCQTPFVFGLFAILAFLHSSNAAVSPLLAPVPSCTTVDGSPCPARYAAGDYSSYGSYGSYKRMTQPKTRGEKLSGFEKVRVRKSTGMEMWAEQHARLPKRQDGKDEDKKEEKDEEKEEKDEEKEEKDDDKHGDKHGGKHCGGRYHHHGGAPAHPLLAAVKGC